MSEKETKPESERDKLYRMLCVTMIRVEELGSRGIVNPTELMSRELRGWWRMEKAASRSTLTERAKKNEEARIVREARKKLTPAELKLLKAS